MPADGIAVNKILDIMIGKTIDSRIISYSALVPKKLAIIASRTTPKACDAIEVMTIKIDACFTVCLVRENFITITRLNPAVMKQRMKQFH